MNKWYKIQYPSEIVEWLDEHTFNYQLGIGNLCGATLLETSTTDPNKT